MGTLLQRWGKAKKASSAKKQRGREEQAAKFSGGMPVLRPIPPGGGFAVLLI